MLMSRTLLTGIALTTTLGIAACHNPPRASTGPPGVSTETPSPTIAPSRSATPNNYKSAAKPCDAVDFRPLETVLGESTGDPLPEKATSAGPITFMTCSRRLGPATAAATVLIEIETFRGVSAEDQYHGLRTAREQSMPITDVPGLGQGAYTRIDPQTGPHLTVYDGNLYLEIAVLGATTSTNQAELFAAMTQTSRQILASLKS